MKPYRASNKRIIQRDGRGRFRKSTLEDLGISKDELQEEPAICANCDHEWLAILKIGYCPMCNCQEKKN